MKKLRFILDHKRTLGALPIMAIGILMLGSCNPFYESLEEEDYEYVYPKKKEIYFLENKNDTVVFNPGYLVRVAKGGSTFGMPEPDTEYVFSTLTIDSAKYDIRISKFADSEYIKFWVECNNCSTKRTDDFEISIHCYNISSTGIDVLGKSYYHYYKIEADSTSEHLKVAYYNKEYGFLKVELQDGYLLELIPD